jgi:hypothetical protein
MLGRICIALSVNIAQHCVFPGLLLRRALSVYRLSFGYSHVFARIQYPLIYACGSNRRSKSPVHRDFYAFEPNSGSSPVSDLSLTVQRH